MEEVTVRYAINGKEVYVDTSSSVSHISKISSKEGKYTIIHDQKVYMNAEGENIGLELPLIGENNIVSKLEKAKFTSGTEEINGKKYQYEEMFVDGEYNRFYFDLETRIWSYWKFGENQLLEIEEYKNEVEEDLFKIPEGYQEVQIP